MNTIVRIKMTPPLPLPPSLYIHTYLPSKEFPPSHTNCHAWLQQIDVPAQLYGLPCDKEKKDDILSYV